jgi:Na+/H+ antiporter NhaD/arsenite permease-like protein
MDPLWLAGSIFLLTYAFIVSEKIHRTISALLGGLAMILFVLPQEQAFQGMYRKVCKWLKLGTGLQSEWQAG